MIYQDEELNGFGSGIPHICSVLRGIDTERLPGLKAFAYKNGTDKFVTRTVQGMNGPEEVAYLIGDRYNIKRVAEEAVEKGYASNADIVDPRSQELLEKRLRDYIV